MSLLITKISKITLPEGFVTVNGDEYTFTASNLEDAAGNTLAEGENTAELDLTENVAPTVNKALDCKWQQPSCGKLLRSYSIC